MAESDHRRKSTIRSSVSKVRSKIDEELLKEKSNVDILEELMEQLLITEDCLDKKDGEVKEETKTEDLEDEANTEKKKERYEKRKTQLKKLFL